VANGKVYVASYEQLDIFGLLTAKTKGAATLSAPVKAPRIAAGAPNQVTGKLIAKNASQLTVRTRAGKIVHVDASEAIHRERSVLLLINEAFSVQGKYDSTGVLHATAIVRAKPSSGTWPPDR
jgi:hypothetical protein